MLDFILGGGAASIFVILLGGTALGLATAFARQPRESRIGTLRAVQQATAWGAVAGTAVDVAAVCTRVPANPEWAHSPDMHLVLLTGLGESMVPLVLGFGLLTLSSCAAAFGYRRLDA
jgi:hypothetical protein